MILIADDNRHVRRMIRDLIKDLDPEIVECADGRARESLRTTSTIRTLS